ncbi:MAG: hypothetical protein F6K14_28560 [Symploca sp. SIO2C1]|nr:hypothetical protein [Symploca sp. SIO2C1]
MLEVMVWSLLVGNLGWQAVVVSRWLRWQQVVSSQQEQEEEEILTRFQSKEDSASTKLPKQGKFNGSDQESTDQQLVGWEFKIVRASRDLFQDRAIFRQLCEEEATSGWILLEKLDDRRVRFKRLIALRDIMDGQQLSYDPYRSHYGTSLTPLHWLGAIAAVLVVLLPLYLGYSLISTRLKQPQQSLPESTYEEIPPQDFPPVERDGEIGR